MSQYVSYTNLSPKFSAFSTNVSQVQIPTTIQDALNRPEWKTAVLEELRALEKNQTWVVADLPKGIPTVGCKWIFTPKFNSDGSLERYKARLVAKGFTQTYGIDYTETFAPVAKLNTVRILLSIVVYMLPPPGFEAKFGSKVCKLEKALYGLKQSPRAWFERFTQVVKNHGYTQAQSDHTLFTRFSNEGKCAVLIVYVDDILLTGDDTKEIEAMKIRLSREFEVKDLGEMKYFLAMEIARSNKGIVVSQRKYIIDLLKETGMSACRPIDTPIDPNKKLGDLKGGKPVDTLQ
ncbi:putative RNA-directed DNA polymerase [Dioscorea sansibarensis]